MKGARQEKILEIIEKYDISTQEELIAKLKNIYGADAPGKSTVYRLITHLVDEGRVKRLVKGHGRSFVYQSVRDNGCKCHLHMKCTSCGRLFHLDEELSHKLLAQVRSFSDFSVDEEETVLFGKCAACN